MTPGVVKEVYAVHAESVGGAWKIDETASARLKEQALTKRKECAVNAEEWWRMERAEVLKKDFSTEITALYADIVNNSASFRGKFLKFWHLSDDFEI